MTKYYSDKRGRYLSIDDLTNDINIGRLSLNSYGDPKNLDFIPDLVKSIITSKSAKHYFYEEGEWSEVILGNLRISIHTKKIHIDGNVDIGLICLISKEDLTLKYFNEFLNYFNG